MLVVQENQSLARSVNKGDDIRTLHDDMLRHRTWVFSAEDDMLLACSLAAESSVEDVV